MRQIRRRKAPFFAALTPAICHLLPKSYVVSTLLCLILFFPLAHLQAQPTPRGTNVVNSATATYIEATLLESSASNPVTTQVSLWHALRFSPPGSVAAPAFLLNGTPGDTLYCRLTLDNLGNAADSVLVAAATIPPTTLSLPAVIFFRDADGDGRLDVGEGTAAFLVLAAGASTPVDVAIVLPTIGGGVAHVELRATSADDFLPIAGGAGKASDATVVRVTSLVSNVAVHLGPSGNPRALPGGEGSQDDATPAAIGLYDETARFAATVENAGDPHSIEVNFDPAVTLPPGVSFVCTDANDVPYPTASQTGGFALGAFAPGELRAVRFELSSPGTALRIALAGLPSIAFRAQSRSDTLVTNNTRYDLDLAVAPNARTMLGLEQTFRQSTGVLGDIVTMIVTATNRTDSVRVDAVIV